MFSFCFGILFFLLDNNEIICGNVVKEKELNSQSSVKTALKCVGLYYYTVLLLTASIFSLYCEAEFGLHILPIEPDTAPLTFNSSLYYNILPATSFIIKTSSP